MTAPTKSLRQEARDFYAASVAAGSPLTAAELAEHFQRSARWGRGVVADFRAAGPVAAVAGPVAAVAGPVAAVAGQVAATAEQAAEAGSDDTANMDTPAENKASVQVTGLPWLLVVAVSVVAVAALAASATHLVHLAEAAGQGWLAYLLPITVDGLLLAASVTVWQRKRQGVAVGRLPILATLLGVAATLVANVIAYTDVATLHPVMVNMAVSGWYPVAAVLAAELLMSVVGQRRERM